MTNVDGNQRAWNRSSGRLRLIIVGLFLAFLFLLTSTSDPFQSVTGQGVSAKEANARLWNCLVPDDATDVWYASSYSFTRVECSIDPESFRLWCERKGVATPTDP
jgi:hypothetical protein